MIKIKIYAKHNDLFSTEIIENNKIIFAEDNYSPGYENLSICSSSDELQFEIDVKTGQIIDWDIAKALKFIEKIKNKEYIEIYEDDNYNEYERWINHLPKVEEKVKEDKLYYTEKFNEAKKEIQKYKNKFSNLELTDKGECIYETNLLKYDNAIFSMYRLLTVSTLLMENGIYNKLENMNRLLVNERDANFARTLLNENNVYKYNFLRRKNDVHSIINNF